MLSLSSDHLNIVSALIKAQLKSLELTRDNLLITALKKAEILGFQQRNINF